MPNFIGSFDLFDPNENTKPMSLARQKFLDQHFEILKLQLKLDAVLSYFNFYRILSNEQILTIKVLYSWKALYANFRAHLIAKILVTY
jgi:hypothetical protein